MGIEARNSGSGVLPDHGLLQSRWNCSWLLGAGSCQDLVVVYVGAGGPCMFLFVVSWYVVESTSRELRPAS